MSETAVKLGSGGRLVIPGPVREAMGIAPGDVVVLVLEEDGLRVLSPEQAIARAQSLVRAHVESDRNLADELIRERREDASAR